MKGKIAVGATAGAITVVGVWMLKYFMSVEMPTEVAGAVQVLVTAAVQIITPDEMEA